jgi:hypothetical protein
VGEALMWYRCKSTLPDAAWSIWRVWSEGFFATVPGYIYQFSTTARSEPFEPGLFRETSKMHGSWSRHGQLVAWFDQPPVGGSWERIDVGHAS